MEEITAHHKLTDNIGAHREMLINALAEMKAKHSLNELVRMSGGAISTATISKIINRKGLDSIDQKMWNKIEALVMSKAQRTDWVLVKTVGSELIKITCEAALKERTLKQITGETGFGKTTGLKAFAQAHPGKAVYVLMDVSMNERDCIKAIAKAYGSTYEGTKHEIVSALATRMIEVGAVLLLDDVGKVIKKFFKLIQAIYDRTEGSCGIVIAGVPALQVFIEKNARKGKESFPEFISRVSWNQQLSVPTKQSIQLICEANGINKEAAAAIASTSREYREVNNMIMAARRLNKTADLTPAEVAQLKVGGFKKN